PLRPAAWNISSLSMSLGRAAISLARPIGELLFPQQCSACGASSGGWLCDACRQSLLELASFPRCGTCALPVAEPDAPCPRCEGRPGRLIATVACLGTHSGVLRHLIHQFKYAHRWTFARPLAQWLAQQMTVQIVLSQADAIVPI